MKREIPLPADAAVETAPAKPRIVVLPFDSLGAKEQTDFTAGMTIEITSRLAKVQGLDVISYASAARYASDDTPTSLLGTELGVQYVLTGFVRRTCLSTAKAPVKTG